MRTLCLLFLVGLCLVPPSATAQEEAVPVTARIPKNASTVMRIASLERCNALAKEMLPLIRMFSPEMAAPVEQMGLSALLSAGTGFDFSKVDASKPAYVAIVGEEQAALLLHPATGATIDPGQELPGGVKASIEDGLLWVRSPGMPVAEARGKPVRMLDGDLSVHVYLDEIVTANRPMIEMMLGMGVAQAGGQLGPLAGLSEALPTVVMGTLDSVASFDYALTWDQGVVYSEGLLRTKADSPLAKFMSRAGKPGGNPLVGYLPKDALLVMDFVSNPDWPGREVAEFMKTSLGPEMGGAIGQMLSVAAPFWDSLSGRQAVSVSMTGMFGASVVQIHELKEGVDPVKMFEAFQPEKLNESLEKMGVPITYKLNRAVDKHGETELHLMSMQSTDPNMAMALAMMQTYLAAEGGHLFVVMAPTAEADIKDLLDRVRAGKPADHPHARAVSKLARSHHIGVSLNIGGLKSMAAMFMMMQPQLAEVVEKIPDELYVTTVLTVQEGGHLQWRGNWPVEEMAKLAKVVQDMQERRQPGAGGEAPPPPDEEFD